MGDRSVLYLIMGIWSLDNRRLAAAKIAGLENVPVTIYDSPSDPAISEVWNDHFTTESSGYDGEKDSSGRRQERSGNRNRDSRKW